MSALVGSLVALLVIVEPIGAVPLFAALTRGRSAREVRRIARRASLVGALVLIGFALAGAALLDGMGVSRHAFGVTGGLLLLATAADMLRGQAARCRCGARELDGAAGRDDVAVVPVAIPLLAGPGAMAAVMNLTAQHPGLGGTAAVIAAIVLVFLVSYPVLRAATVLQRVLGDAILAVVQRVLGLVVASLGVQAVVTGLRALL